MQNQLAEPDDDQPPLHAEPVPFSDEEVAEYKRRAVEYHQGNSQDNQGHVIGYVADWRALAAHAHLN